MKAVSSTLQKEAVKVDAFGAKVEANGAIAYIAIVGIIIIALFWIYAKNFHVKVKNKLRKRK